MTKVSPSILSADFTDFAAAVKRLDAAGADLIHCEVPIGVSSAEEISKIMSEPIEWATGLPLKADAYECEYYRKD